MVRNGRRQSKLCRYSVSRPITSFTARWGWQHLQCLQTSSSDLAILQYDTHCLQAILDNSQSAYAQMLASSSLLKVVTEHTIGYAECICSCLVSNGIHMHADVGLVMCSVPMKLEMRNYFLSYLDR